MCILILCAAFIVVFAIVVHQLRPAQRVAVLVGTLVAGFQVWYPPFIDVDGSISRGVVFNNPTYAPSDLGPCIDGERQLYCLAVTAAVTVAVVVVLFRRRRRADHQ